MCIYAQLKPLYNIVLKNEKRGKFSIKKYFKKKKKENLFQGSKTEQLDFFN